MLRTLLAAVAALAFFAARPALAGCPDCKDCPHKMASADEEKKPATCACADAKECKCGEKCQCPHCSAKKAEKQGATKT